jgi:hypothetical protein
MKHLFSLRPLYREYVAQFQNDHFTAYLMGKANFVSFKDWAQVYLWHEIE